MIKVRIGRDLCNEAANLASVIPEDIKDSITHGKNRFIGTLGEAALARFLRGRGKTVTFAKNLDYDLLVDNLKVEVKSKTCASEPRPEYECSIADYNLKQQCDIYAFTRIDQYDIYLLGWLWKDEYFEKARALKKGDKGDNVFKGEQWEVRANCHNVYIRELRGFKND